MRTETSGGVLLLLSGGIDSAIAAHLCEPKLCLFVDYGQLPADSEHQAAIAVAEHFRLDFESATVDLSKLGSGLLVGAPRSSSAPSPEWFPYRNLYLATIGASIAMKRGLDHVQLGLVAEDGGRHIDGTPEFVDALNDLMQMQEGAVSVTAPLIGGRTKDFLAKDPLSPALLQRTHSCHRSNLPCGRCPGCNKRAEVVRGGM